MSSDTDGSVNAMIQFSALDLETAATTAGIAGIVMAASILLIGRILPGLGQATNRMVSLGLAAFGFGFLMVAFSYRMPLWVSGVAGNALLVGSFVPIGWAVLKIYELPSRIVVWCGLAFTAVCAVENAWFLLFETSVNARLLIGSLCQLGVTIPIVVVPWRIARSKRSIGLWLVFTAFAVFGALLLQRTAMFAMSEGMVSAFDRPALQSASYLAPMVLPLLAGAGFLQLYATDSHAKYRRLSDVDPLTGCLNRRALDYLARDLLRSAQRQARPVSVLVLDLDNLKVINDRYGHASGDLALTLLAGHLQEVSRDGGHVGRIGGDEFVVILESGLDHADRLILALRHRLHEEAPPLFVSVGTSRMLPGDDLWSMTARADQAMYIDKYSRSPKTWHPRDQDKP